MEFSRQKLWMTSRDYILITFGIFLYAFGFSAFIFPEKVVVGGVTGIGTIVYFVTERYLPFAIPVALTQYILNLILLAMAYRSIGRQFVVRTIFGATVISLFIGILQPFFMQPLVAQQTFMNIIIGAILCGVGVGIVFTHNGSTGGTDIVAAMVNKRSNVSIGRMMLYCDMCIISSSFLIWHKIDTVVYGFVVLVIVSNMADMIINTTRQAVQFLIVSPRWEEIATAISNDAKSIDETAFITQSNVNGVYGKGFDALKFKVEPKHPHTDKDNETDDQPAEATETTD